MILGMSLSTFTLLHVVISLVGILAGFVAVFGMRGARWSGGWTALFLWTTVLTSVTGFLFPFTKLLPSHIVGFISLAVLAVTLFALYVRRLAGAWRWIFVVGAVVSLYLNTFVGVVQAFQKVKPLAALAPTQSELPFVAAQGVLLVAMIVLGFLVVRAFHPAPPPLAARSA